LPALLNAFPPPAPHFLQPIRANSRRCGGKVIGQVSEYLRDAYREMKGLTHDARLIKINQVHARNFGSPAPRFLA